MHLAVLSPHRDDAAFSCGLLLTRLLRAGATVHLVNICTQSDYAPYLAATDEPRATKVSRVRRDEDLAFLACLQQESATAGVRMTDLEWLDSPLRLGIATDHVLDPRSTAAEEVEALAEALRPWRTADAVLAPLGMGNHIDHRLVRDAACAVFAPSRLGFYQDLPYSCWMPPEERHGTAQTLAQRHGPRNLPWIASNAAPDGTLHGLKRRYALCYPSQIAPDLAEAMEADAAALQGAERMHLPAPMAAWFTTALRNGRAAHA